MSSKFSDEDIKKIINMYLNENKNTVEISKIYKCSNTTIGRILRKNNINVRLIGNKRKQIQLTDREIDDICNRYINGETSVELGKIYKCSDVTIIRILRDRNIKIRKGVRRSIIKYHDYFEDINTPGKAYFLGLLISDGSVVKQKRKGRNDVISLSLDLNDKYIVELFAKELGADINSVKEYTNNGRSECYFRFSSQKMSDDLFKYGVVSNKSQATFLPILDKCLMPHLIRGIFDGDGTVYLYKEKYIRFGFYGSKEICEQINIFLNKAISSNINSVTLKSGCCLVAWQGINVARAFYDYIYQNSSEFFLKRKKNKFVENIK